jgi:hypothetical protein
LVGSPTIAVSVWTLATIVPLGLCLRAEQTSEIEPQAKVDLTRSFPYLFLEGASNLSYGSRRADICGRIREVRMIEDIGGDKAELRPNVFFDKEILHGGEIEVNQVRAP